MSCLFTNCLKRQIKSSSLSSKEEICQQSDGDTFSTNPVKGPQRSTPVKPSTATTTTTKASSSLSISSMEGDKQHRSDISASEVDDAVQDAEGSLRSSSNEENYPQSAGDTFSTNPVKGPQRSTPVKPSTATTTTTEASSLLSISSTEGEKQHRSYMSASEEPSVRESLTLSSASGLPQQYLQSPASPRRSSSPHFRSSRKDALSPETISGTEITEIIGDDVSVDTELSQSVAIDDDSSPEFMASQRRHHQQNQRQQYQEEQYQLLYTDTNSTLNTEPINNIYRETIDPINPSLAESSVSSSKYTESTQLARPNNRDKDRGSAIDKPHANGTRSQTHTSLNPNASSNEVRAHYEAILSQASSSHSNEIDTILEQLNSLEGTYTLELQSMQDELSKREIMTDALINSRTEMRTKCFNDRNALLSLETENSCLREELRRKKGELERWRTKVQEVKNERKAVVEREESRRVDAVAQAQEEIRTVVEEQFAQAQQKFFQLKQDYEVALNERDELSEIVDTVNKEGEMMVRKQKGQLATLMAELAESKAELARAQADAMKLKQINGEKVQKLLDRENELEGRLTKVGKECKDAHQLVEQIVMEKDELKVENQELQNVCEELMGMVEGSKNK